jgi:inner membrane transporter RhtA
MSAGALTRRAGAIAPCRPPDRRRPPRAAQRVTDLAPRVVGPACILASCASLQTAAAIATTAFAALGPAGTGALRFLGGAVVLMTFVRPRLRGRSTAFWLTTAALGAATAATNLFLYEAIARIPLGMAGTLVFLGPLTLALLGARGRHDVAWAATAALGVVLLTGAPATASVPGIACALGAAVSVAASILIARRLGEHSDGLDGLALSIAVAALLTLPMGLSAALDAPGPSVLAIVAVVGVLGIAIPYALEFTALRRVGVKTYGILLSLDPAVAGLAGLLLLGQRLDTAEMIGMALVMAASIGASAAKPCGS